MQGVFELIAEPRRRQILDALREGERAVGDLVAATALSQPTVSKHLRVLRDGGLVTARVERQRRIYRLRPEPLRELSAWLEPYRRRWPQALDALAQHLDAMERAETEDDHGR